MTLSSQLAEAVGPRFFKKTKNADGLDRWVLADPKYAKYRDRFEVSRGPGGYAVDDLKVNDSAGFKSLGEVAYWIDQMIEAKP